MQDRQTAAKAGSAATAHDTAFFGHPKGLMTIFFTEMWERFGYYGMRALLVLYMTKAFLFSDEKSYAVYGAFTAFVYVTPILGGILADNLLGFRWSVSAGALIMAIGYFALSIPKAWLGGHYELMLYTSLAIIIIGNGLFKPNTSSLVGTLYQKSDSRKDAGYTIFYMGINTGSIIAPLICGYIGEVYGWSYGFLVTALGLVFGLAAFLRGEKYLGDQGLPPHPEKLKAKSFLGFTNLTWLIVASVLSVPAVVLILTGNISSLALSITGVLTIAYIVSISWRSPKRERNKVYGLMLMMFFYAAFFACFEQAGSSINLFTDRNVDRHLAFSLLGHSWDFMVPTTFFQAINPIFIIFFAPLLAGLWTKLSQMGREPSTAMKFIFGLGFASVGFYTLVIGCNFADSNGMTPMLWLFLGYFFMTIGELTLSPVGLAMVSKQAPHKILGLLMGALMLSVAFGNYIAAILAKLASAPVDATHSLSPISTQAIYSHAFKEVALFAAAFTVLLALLRPVINILLAETAAEAEAEALEEKKILAYGQGEP